MKTFLYVCEVAALLMACWASLEGRHDVAAGNMVMACYFLLHLELRQKRTESENEGADEPIPFKLTEAGRAHLEGKK